MYKITQYDVYIKYKSPFQPIQKGCINPFNWLSKGLPSIQYDVYRTTIRQPLAWTSGTVVY